MGDAPALTLYAESTWMSPWVFHVLVALEEKRLPYAVEVVPLPMPEAVRTRLREKTVLGKVPILVHGELWITESLAISEYLAERFPAPAHPRLFPADLGQRARARQLMSMLRTSLFALREERPTSTVFGRPTTQPLSERAQADAAELVRVASAVIQPGRLTLFDDWCIADTDLALTLMRLVANHDPVPEHVSAYALAQWGRPSVGKFVAHVPTMK
ncbi:MAG TPA: glutathione transferase [Kofleriaceae bacterium]|nr:glutathione transferase [Kofleriaceae bacterium]